MSFCGYSESGKTTLLAQVIPELRRQGLKVGVIKHDGHDFEMDHPGTDSWKFAAAGADVVAISSPAQTAYIEKRQQELTVRELIDRIRDVDCILIEGYKHEELPKILVSRKGIPAPADISRELIIGAVTDEPECFFGTDFPVFDFTQIHELACFILSYIK